MMNLKFISMIERIKKLIFLISKNISSTNNLKKQKLDNLIFKRRLNKSGVAEIGARLGQNESEIGLRLPTASNQKPLPHRRNL